uniref:Transmembrane protein n=1 Tax=Knipowitschia caucasica TaxID=637954 RepID=A0AAV2L9P5_KNICA
MRREGVIGESASDTRLEGASPCISRLRTPVAPVRVFFWSLRQARPSTAPVSFRAGVCSLLVFPLLRLLSFSSSFSVGLPTLSSRTVLLRSFVQATRFVPSQPSRLCVARRVVVCRYHRCCSSLVPAPASVLPRAPVAYPCMFAALHPPALCPPAAGLCRARALLCLFCSPWAALPCLLLSFRATLGAASLSDVSGLLERGPPVRSCAALSFLGTPAALLGCSAASPLVRAVSPSLRRLLCWSLLEV